MNKKQKETFKEIMRGYILSIYRETGIKRACNYNESYNFLCNMYSMELITENTLNLYINYIDRIFTRKTKFDMKERYFI